MVDFDAVVVELVAAADVLAAAAAAIAAAAPTADVVAIADVVVVVVDELGLGFKIGVLLVLGLTSKFILLLL